MLVREFLQNSSLKVLPANQFEDAVIRFIEKGGKETVDEFINETLTKSLDYLVKIDDSKLDKDMDAAMEQCKERLEKRWAQAGGKWEPRRKLKPRPENWDSDMEGPWDDPKIADRWETIAQQQRGGGNPGDEDVDMDVSMSDENTTVSKRPSKAAPKRGAGAKQGRGGAAKKAAPPKARASRPKKQGGFLVDSDEDEEDGEAQDMVMSEDEFIDDDEEDEPAPPAPAKRASRATKSTPAPKATPSRAAPSRAAKPAASKSKQTTLNFSQSQRPSRSSTNQKPLTISDDEIDDDDDDDAFEPVQTTRSRRR